MRCTLCPRSCTAARACIPSDTPVVARAALHHWEEPCLSGTNGSGTVFFAGCSLRCIYCQNKKISREHFGQSVTPAQLRQIFNRLIEKGAHNVNLVTPSHFTPGICQALEGGLSVPVVWNSSGYELPDSLNQLAGKVQVFLPDFKYGQEEPARRLSAAPGYPAIAVNAIERMIALAGPPRFDPQGMLVGGVLVRHLVLPGYLENTRQVIDLFARHFAGRALFSLMGQYVPGQELPPPLNRRLTRREYDRMADYMLACGIREGYVQDEGADDERYTPPFDLTGVEDGGDVGTEGNGSLRRPIF